MFNHGHPDEDLQSFVLAQDFPCVGAKSALARNQIVFCPADDIRSAASDAIITDRLQKFSLQCTSESLFVSFVVIFVNTPPMNELEFEHYLWERLQALHDKDVLNYEWDAQVSSDPESPDFSLSIGGKGFYVVGLHPGSSRPARRFSKPALVFNLHSQFELLRDGGNYQRIRQTILERDMKLSGTLNPMLAEHGQSSEALQYSGRKVERGWKCPFHRRRKETL